MSGDKKSDHLSERGVGVDDSVNISRREALERLAKLSVYTAPTVTTLLNPKLSYAMGSGIPGDPNNNPNECTTANGAHNLLGVDNSASEVQGDVANDNMTPLYLNHPEYHDWYNGSGSDHMAYWMNFYMDSNTDCGS